MKFGDCLAALVETYGWKRSQLARAMAKEGVDPSLTYRWLRNERTPRLDSSHGERIAACLALSPEDYERLRQAQVESLQRSSYPFDDRRREGTFWIPPGGQQETGGSRKVDGVFSLRPSTLLLPPGPIWERAKMLQAAATLLEGAAEFSSAGNHEILLTSQSEGGFDSTHDHLPQWLELLRSVLERGYNLVHLLRIDADSQRSLGMVEQMLTLLGTAGSYRPFCFNRYGAPAYPYEMLIVPTTGALLSFVTGDSGQVDAALLLRDPQQIAVLGAHFLGLKAQTRPLLKSRQRPKDALEQLQALARAEEKEGDLFLSRHGLSSHTQPYSWFREDSNWARGISTRGLDPGMLIGLQKRRLDTFYRQVESYRFREICPKSALLRMVREGQATSLIPGRQILPEDRLEHLENVIALLNSFENFELALVSEAEEKEYVSANFWQVKWDIRGDHSVMLEVPSTRNDSRETRLGLEILEPAICGAFHHYFLELFDNRISPTSKDKREVRQFLEGQIAWLREQMGTS